MRAIWEGAQLYRRVWMGLQMHIMNMLMRMCKIQGKIKVLSSGLEKELC